MAAQVGGKDVVIVAQGARDPIPVAAMVAPAVNQKKRRRAGISPIDVMQPEALGEINPRGRTVRVKSGRHDLAPIKSSETIRPPCALSLRPRSDKRGSRCEVFLRARQHMSSYLLVLTIGCRCQAVGN